MPNVTARVNGKICVVKNHSVQNAEIAGLTLRNHWEYAYRHGYDMVVLVEPWESAKWGLLATLARILERYESIFCLGSDVIITNPEIRIETYFAPEHGAVVSTEEAGPGWSPINNDTLIVHNNALGREYLGHLIERAPNYSHPLMHQQLTLELMHNRPGLVVAKRIQSIPLLDSPARWKEGDFCLHFLAHNYAVSKTECVRRFLTTGEVTWHPQRTPRLPPAPPPKPPSPKNASPIVSPPPPAPPAEPPGPGKPSPFIKVQHAFRRIARSRWNSV